MVKLLHIKETLNTSVFRNVATNSEAVEYLLKKRDWIQISTEDSHLEVPSKQGDVQSMELLLKYADKLYLVRSYQYKKNNC
jgi:hypothetical protein